MTLKIQYHPTCVTRGSFKKLSRGTTKTKVNNKYHITIDFIHGAAACILMRIDDITGQTQLTNVYKHVVISTGVPVCVQVSVKKNEISFKILKL